MSLETDLLLDRRRLKRGLAWWRVVAVLALLAAALLLAGPRLPGLERRHVARLEIAGLISDDRKLIEAIDRAGRDDAVAAMLVDIDSPGGTVGGGEALHDAIARVAAKKPVAAVMRGMAASAGYMAALPAQRIFAREATLTGSIGVLLEAPEISGLLGKLGIDATTLVSGPLKDQPSFTHPLSPEGRAVTQGLVNDMYAMFVEMVAADRHMDIARVRQLADGRAYTGRQAKQLALVDEIGGEAEARAWLERSRHVPASLPARTVKPGSWRERTFDAAGSVGSLGEWCGAWLAGALRGAAGATDGAMALWRPGAAGGTTGGFGAP